MTMNSPENNATETDISLFDRVFAFILYILPHHLLSQIMHWLTRCEWRPLKNLLIRGAIKLYKVDMSIAKRSYPESYPTFNAFFTRGLKPDARPVSDGVGDIVSPVDGAVSQAGDIVDGRIFQAKGQDFSLLELLGGKGSAQDKTVPDGFLETMMMMQEELADAKADNDRNELDRLRGVLVTQHDGLMKRIARIFEDHQQSLGCEAVRKGLLDEIRKQLNAVSYVRKLQSQLP